MAERALPTGAELVRATALFDEQTVPAGLLAEHRVASGMWGLLVVSEGSLMFGFDDSDVIGVGVDAEVEVEVGPGPGWVIPPDRLHHVAITGPVRFRVEFYRVPSTDTVAP